ncbi:MAG: hypothetical protein LBQ81_00025, partial [Zoogloeaceae bacterium]|nr:hypothetical protein [Zoogloeaceae bacterium]
KPPSFTCGALGERALPEAPYLNPPDQIGGDGAVCQPSEAASPPTTNANREADIRSGLKAMPLNGIRKWEEKLLLHCNKTRRDSYNMLDLPVLTWEIAICALQQKQGYPLYRRTQP